MSGSDQRDEEYQPQLNELIPLSMAVEISGYTHPHLALLARQGKLWAMKIGGRWVTTESAVREYLARDPRPGPKTKEDDQSENEKI